MPWTDERVETLKRLWAEGKTKARIAEELGEVTPNSVAGKLHRLGLTNQKTRRQRMQRKKRKLKTPQPRAAQSTRQASYEGLFVSDGCVPTVEELVVPLKQRKTLKTLAEHHCRWPIGDPLKSKDFHFCGKGKLPGLPYCEFHARQAFLPPRSGKRARA